MIPALAHTGIAPQAFGDAALDRLHATLRAADDAWRAARASRQPDADVRRLAAVYVAAAEAFQRAKYGAVKCRISVPHLLRAC